MKHNNTYLGKCCLIFCDNEAHYTCDKCEDDFCKEDMKNDSLCYECK